MDECSNARNGSTQRPALEPDRDDATLSGEGGNRISQSVRAVSPDWRSGVRKGTKAYPLL